MRQMYKFPSIEQYRHTVKAMTFHAENVYDVQQEQMVKVPKPQYPTHRFFGTPKIHGTNGGVVVTRDGDVYAMSRSKVLAVGDDNYGFAGWLAQEEVTNFFKKSFEARVKHIEQLREENGVDYADLDTMIFYGEWFGKGVQKNVAVSELEDRWFGIFEICERYNEVKEGEGVIWYTPVAPHAEELNIVFVASIKYWSMDIDFSQAQMYTNDLIELTNQVEKECPVGKFFGIEGLGEGVVWRYADESGDKVFRFKVKGEKHSVTKVKTLTAVDIEKMNSVQEFVDYAVTENRLEQMAEETLAVDGIKDFDRKNLGKFIKAVSTDVVKEEKDTLEKAGLTMKDVGSDLSKKAREWFFQQEEASMSLNA